MQKKKKKEEDERGGGGGKTGRKKESEGMTDERETEPWRLGGKTKPMGKKEEDTGAQ